MSLFELNGRRAFWKWRDYRSVLLFLIPCAVLCAGGISIWRPYAIWLGTGQRGIIVVQNSTFSVGFWLVIPKEEDHLISPVTDSWLSIETLLLSENGATRCNGRYLNVPLWTYGPVCIFTMLISIWQLNGSRRLADNKCRNCGYDLRATPSRCPECGWWAGSCCLSRMRPTRS